MQLPSVSPRRPDVLRPVRLDPTGRTGPTRHQAEGRAWQRVSRGLYLPADVTIDTPQRIANAAAALPAGCGVTGWAALHWCGAAWFDGVGRDGLSLLPVDLATGPHDIRSQVGSLVSAEHFGPWDVVEHDGLRLTTTERSVLFVMRHAADVVEATVALDMACQGDVVSLEETAAYAGRLGTWTGIPQAREAIRLADEDSWSPWETRLRLLWTGVAGRPRPSCNLPVFDPLGRHLGTPDLIDPDAGVVGEYDGALHLGRRQRRRDLGREARFRAVGLEYVAVVGGDMFTPHLVAQRIDEAYDRARRTPITYRQWSTTPPLGWRAPRGVEQRRALHRRTARATA